MEERGEVQMQVERGEVQMQIYEDSIGQYSREMDEVDGFFYSDE